MHPSVIVVVGLCMITYENADSLLSAFAWTTVTCFGYEVIRAVIMRSLLAHRFSLYETSFSLLVRNSGVEKCIASWSAAFTSASMSKFQSEKAESEASELSAYLCREQL